MGISDLLPPAIAWLAMTLPRARARVALAGGVIAALGLASLAVAGPGDWRLARLPEAYLAVTAALLTLGAGLALWAAAMAIRSGELPDRPVLSVLAILVVTILWGWVTGPIGIAGGAVRGAVSTALIGGTGWILMLAGRRLGVAERLRAIDRRLFGARPAPGVRLRSPGLLVVHLLLGLIAFVSPHVLLLLLAVSGTVVTGVLLAGSGPRRSWPVFAGLALLLLVAGFTISIAGDTPLSLAAFRDGPFSPAFEPIAALGFLLALWPLLGIFPFHGRWNGPATPLAGAAILIRLAVPTMSGGTEHWQPLVFPLLVLSAWYGAGITSARLVLVTVATAGLVTLLPRAQWAGVVLLSGEALVSTVRHFVPGRRFESGVVGLAAVVVLAGLIPLFTGALQAQVFYTVMLAVGAALSFMVREPALPR